MQYADRIRVRRIEKRKQNGNTFQNGGNYGYIVIMD